MIGGKYQIRFYTKFICFSQNFSESFLFHESKFLKSFDLINLIQMIRKGSFI